MNSKFSIITSFYCWHVLKQQQAKRCVRSVSSQTYKKWEHILIDDGSPLGCDFYMVKKRKVYNQPHLERLHAISKGLEVAQGDWIVMLDSDDELLSYSLQAFNQMIKKYPEYKIFNFQTIHVGRNYNTNIRAAFKPSRDGEGHEIFGGGNIVNGSFIFHRSLLDKLSTPEKPFLPTFTNPWDFSLYAQEEFPEIKPFFQVVNEDHPEGVPKELGNPWGQDFYLFYKLTRKHHSLAFNIPLILIHHEGKEADGRHKID